MKIDEEPYKVLRVDAIMPMNGRSQNVIGMIYPFKSKREARAYIKEEMAGCNKFTIRKGTLITTLFKKLF